MNHIELDLTKAKNYMSEVLDDLPQNCMFNKVLCGAGGTHMALTNDKPYVVLVPYIELIKSKLNQTDKYPNIQPIYGEISNQEIKKALDNGCTKFMSTYHGLRRIIEIFGEQVANFQLLVDEAHMLTEGDDKDFMHNEINYLLQSYTKFKSFCFMTATPYEEESIPEQLQTLPLIKAKWADLGVTALVAQRIEGKFNDYICQIALEHMDGRRDGDPFFFYNSVEAIAIIAKKLIDSKICEPLDIRIIAADKNDSYLKKYANKDLTISSTYECKNDPRKINFVTAKAFEGCDIEQSSGVTYICADGRKKHTRLEIHTKIPQIVNRIRDSKYKDVAYLLYTTSFTRDCKTKEEFKEVIKQNMIRVDRVLAEIKKLSDDSSAYLNMEMLDSDEFITKDLNNEMILNPNAGKRALSQWASANQLFFYNTLCEQHITNVRSRSTLIEILNEPNPVEFFKPPAGTDKIKLGGKVANFKKLCKDYITAIESGDIESRNFIEDFSPIFAEARRVFRANLIEDITASAMQQTRLQQRIDVHNQACSKMIDIKNNLRFNINDFYTIQEVKDEIQSVYDKFNIKKKAKSTEIEIWFNVKKTIKNGISGYSILSFKN
ncbi:MAG: DEAD/DEAH box helicase family protein [Candidatus Riesia sp.]|nr:DEAD/DEAH box helicase family protein [Candidatus Riesia sp.]